MLSAAEKKQLRPLAVGEWAETAKKARIAFRAFLPAYIYETTKQKVDEITSRHIKLAWPAFMQSKEALDLQHQLKLWESRAEGDFEEEAARQWIRQRVGRIGAAAMVSLDDLVDKLNLGVAILDKETAEKVDYVAVLASHLRTGAQLSPAKLIVLYDLVRCSDTLPTAESLFTQMLERGLLLDDGREAEHKAQLQAILVI